MRNLPLLDLLDLPVPRVPRLLLLDLQAQPVLLEQIQLLLVLRDRPALPAHKVRLFTPVQALQYLPARHGIRR